MANAIQLVHRFEQLHGLEGMEGHTFTVAYQNPSDENVTVTVSDHPTDYPVHVQTVYDALESQNPTAFQQVITILENSPQIWPPEEDAFAKSGGGGGGNAGQGKGGGKSA